MSTHELTSNGPARPANRADGTGRNSVGATFSSHFVVRFAFLVGLNALIITLLAMRWTADY